MLATRDLGYRAVFGAIPMYGMVHKIKWLMYICTCYSPTLLLETLRSLHLHYKV